MNCHQRLQTPAPTKRGRPSVNELWHGDSPAAWSEALEHYWSFVKPQNMPHNITNQMSQTLA
jgi:hypothetical protein